MLELDLHGLYPAEALERLELFLYTLYNRRQASARIIYGIGSGRLGEAVLAALKRHPLVRGLEEEVGSCILHVEI